MSLTWRQVSAQNTGDPSSLMAYAGRSLGRGMRSLEDLGAQFQKGNTLRQEEQEQVAIGKLKQSLAGKTPEEINQLRQSGQLQQMAQGLGVNAADSYDAVNTVNDDIWSNVANRLDRDSTQASIASTEASTQQSQAATQAQNLQNEQTEDLLAFQEQEDNVLNNVSGKVGNLLSSDYISSKDGDIKSIVDEVGSVYDTALNELPDDAPRELRQSLQTSKESDLARAKSFMEMTDEERQQFTAWEQGVDEAVAPVAQRVNAYWDNQIKPVEAEVQRVDAIENYGTETIASLGSASTQKITETFSNVFGEDELENVGQEEIQDVKNTLNAIASNISAEEGEDIPVGVIVDVVAEMNGGIDNVGGFMGWFETVKDEEDIRPLVEKRFNEYKIGKEKRKTLADLKYQRDIQTNKLQNEVKGLVESEAKRGRKSSSNRGKEGYAPSAVDLKELQDRLYSSYVGKNPIADAQERVKNAESNANEKSQELKEAEERIANLTKQLKGAGKTGGSNNGSEDSGGYSWSLGMW